MAPTPETRNTSGLWRGNPGNAGGGRPKKAFRDACKDIVEAALPELRLMAINKPVKRTLADGKKSEVARRPYSAREQVDALRLLGRFAGLEVQSLEVEQVQKTLVAVDLDKI